MKTCEFCATKNTVSSVQNPWNRDHIIDLCDNCYENASDNARERQGNDYSEEDLEYAIAQEERKNEGEL